MAQAVNMSTTTNVAGWGAELEYMAGNDKDLKALGGIADGNAKDSSSSIKGFASNPLVPNSITYPSRTLPPSSSSSSSTSSSRKPHPPLRTTDIQSASTSHTQPSVQNDPAHPSTQIPIQGPVRIPGRLLWLRHNQPDQQNQYYSSWTSSQVFAKPLPPSAFPQPVQNLARIHTAPPTVPSYQHYTFLHPQKAKPNNTGRSTAPPALYLNTSIPPAVSEITPPDSALKTPVTVIDPTTTGNGQPAQRTLDQNFPFGQPQSALYPSVQPNGLLSGFVNGQAVPGQAQLTTLTKADPTLLGNYALGPYDAAQTHFPLNDDPSFDPFASHLPFPSFAAKTPLNPSTMTHGTIYGNLGFHQQQYASPFNSGIPASNVRMGGGSVDSTASSWMSGADGSDSVETMSSNTDESQHIKGQRGWAPLSGYDNDVLGAVKWEDGQERWGVDIGMDDCIPPMGYTAGKPNSVVSASRTQLGGSSLLTTRAMYPNQHAQQQGEQEAMYYPSQHLNTGERPLQVPSKTVPIGGQGMQGASQWAVPVIQRGDQYFWDNEHPIQSASSYTYGAQGQMGRNFTNNGGENQMGRHGGMVGMAGSRSAIDTLSHQSLLPQVPRTFHGYSGAQNGNGMNFDGPMTARPAMNMSGGGDNFFIPPNQAQHYRNQSSDFGGQSRVPHTPSPQRRSAGLGFDQAQILRSAAPEPEAPSAFMMAYQGGRTPGSAQISRMPPSSVSRHGEMEIKEEEEDYDDLPAYEIERLKNIRQNEQLLQSLGLGGAPDARHESRSPSKSMKRRASSINMKANPAERKARFKNRIPSMGPVRTSNRIASMARTVSYADLDGGRDQDQSFSDDDSFSSNDMEEDGEWDGDSDEGPRKKGKKRGMGRTFSGRWVDHRSHFRGMGRIPTLRELVNDHPEIKETFPLFYYILTADMIIDNNRFPLIGSIPSTCTPGEKAAYLKKYFHKGRRCISQLDGFTARCDKRYDGPGQRWKPLTSDMKLAIRDVRRKGVERCENFKYTRRDILNKHLGKGKWEPIEDGMIHWTPGAKSTDPANDLDGVELHSPPLGSDTASQLSAGSSKARITSRKRSQAYGSRRVSRADLSRMPLRLQTSDVFTGGYSNERGGMGMPSVPMSYPAGDMMQGQGQQYQVTPQAYGTPGGFHSPYQTGSAIEPNGTPLKSIASQKTATPSIVRAARMFDNDPQQASSPFSTPGANQTLLQMQYGDQTPTANAMSRPTSSGAHMLVDQSANAGFHHAGTEIGSNAGNSQAMSVDDGLGMMNGGFNIMDFNDMSEISMQGGSGM